MATAQSWKKADLCFQTKLPLTYTAFTLGCSYLTLPGNINRTMQRPRMTALLSHSSENQIMSKVHIFQQLLQLKWLQCWEKGNAQNIIITRQSKYFTENDNRAAEKGCSAHIKRKQSAFSWLKHGFNCVAKATSNQYGINSQDRVWKEWSEVCTYIYPLKWEF